MSDRNDFRINNGVLEKYCGTDTQVVVPNDVTKIGDDAFAYRTHVTNIYLHDNINRIGRRAFESCTDLLEISLPRKIKMIHRHAFEYCRSLTTMNIPSSVTKIDYKAFYCCDKLTDISVPSSVKSIGDIVFYGCKSLKSITLPEGVEEIGSYAFESCSALASIFIPSSVTYIGENAFQYCPNVRIYGPAGSYAQTYAKENNIPFVAKQDDSLESSTIGHGLFGDPNGKIGTFAILPTENPMGYESSTVEDFRQKIMIWTGDSAKGAHERISIAEKEELRKRIEVAGADCLQYGAYSYAQIHIENMEKGKALVVFNLCLSDAKHIAANHGQEFFFYGKTVLGEDGLPCTAIEFHKSYNCCQTYRLVETADSVVTPEDAVKFFTKYGCPWVIQMSDFADDLKPIENEEAFLLSMDEERTAKSRAMHRRAAYRKKDNP